MREVKVYCRFPEVEMFGAVIIDSVKRLNADYIMDFKGLKLCVRKSQLTEKYIVFDAGSGQMIAGDLDKSLAIERALILLQKIPNDRIKKATKQHVFYGIPAMRMGMNIVVLNTLLGNNRAIKIYERRTGIKFTAGGARA
ncbi:hypothetical protein HB943_02045 [Listeria weihenstephanensis]|uniref:Uncharacterized protein n=1 Tax=Listeria weihenstephanensis TaxID=1006155 RepID=A0A841Z2E9_9LIST|nr:hypothetical protein [Listeria weihenstephanensis]MBC1499368.1 hypothetical protein [Listeria weihenstephanensis]